MYRSILETNLYSVEFNNYLGKRVHALLITDKDEEGIKNYYSYADTKNPDFNITKLC